MREKEKARIFSFSISLSLSLSQLRRNREKEKHLANLFLFNQLEYINTITSYRTLFYRVQIEIYLLLHHSTTMLQTTNLIYENVNLTDELKINLQYDIHTGLLNIFVKNTGHFPSQINILANDSQLISSSSKFHQDIRDDRSYGEEDEPKICIELSNIYVYDLDEEHDLDQTIITSPTLLFSSSSSSSSCFDDNDDDDDGYSTHSLDDIEQQYALAIPALKFIQPFVPYQSHYSEDYYLDRLIDQMMWLNPFKKTVKQMIIHYLFDGLN